ncbi:MAG: alpha/beta hydrolase [Gammaproteobacteria bacterium]|nr:alpha/beta hydrolase [Gammaproteobacteria bacterium]
MPGRNRCSTGRRALRFAAALVLLVAAGGAAATEGPRYPGRVVSVGTHGLHIHCLGEGTPAVIMDSGLGGTSLEWVGVQLRLARHVRACVYDRAGYGWSDPGPGPRTSSRIADELFVLLSNAGVDGPSVLVAQSFGGYTMEVFARRYPYLTAGLVLVDASHPDQIERFRRPPVNLNTAPRTRRGMLSYSQPPSVPASLPAEFRDAALALARTWKARQALKQEYLYFEQSARDVLAAGELPPVPMVVLTRGRRAWPHDTRGDLIENLWLAMQDDLSAQSPHAAHIIAASSGHHIHLDQPDLVSDAVTMVIDFARTGASAPDFSIDPEIGYSGAAWLEFADAWWRYDTLHAALRLRAPVPFLHSAGGVIRAGHFAGTARPAHQQVVYYR